MKFLITFLALSQIFSKVIHLDHNSYENFGESLDKYILIFCHKNISECKNVNSTFLKLNSKIAIGRVDVNDNKIIAELYNILSYPHIILKHNDETYLYNGPLNPYKIDKFISDKLDTHIMEVKSLAELREQLTHFNIPQTIVFVGNPNSTLFNITLLAEACKTANINRIFYIKSKDVMDQWGTSELEFDLFLVEENLNKKRLYIHILDDYLNRYKLTHFIQLNVRNIYGTIYKNDLNIALGSDPVTTMFFIYNNNESYLQTIHEELKLIAEQYRDQVNIVHGTVKNKIMQLVFRYVGISSSELPAFVITRKNPYSDDDVEKYLYKAGGSLSRDDLINMFIKPDPQKRVYTAEKEEMRLAGDNLVPVLSEPLQEGKEILLLICPVNSKKYNRVKDRVTNVFESIYKANNETLLVDEFDPLLNELTGLSYRSIPSILIITKTNNPSKLWDFIVYHGDFSTEDIIKFTLNNSKQKLKHDPISDSIKAAEKDKPITQVSKFLFEKITLLDTQPKKTIEYGLKRMWRAMQLKNIVPEYEKIEYFEPEDEDFDKFDLEMKKSEL
jgi:hypothetical protein